MIGIIISSLGCLVIFLLLDKLALWLESKGWLYYRKHKLNRDTLGDSLQELNTIYIPSTRHAIEVKQNEGVRGARGRSL